MFLARFFSQKEPLSPPVGERPEVHALWQMYATVRSESISAQQMLHSVIYWSMTAGSVLIAAVAFLRQATWLAIDPWVVQVFAWFTFFMVGLLGGTQYISEAGRMMRAGFYAQLVEQELQKLGAGAPSSLEMWETYLKKPQNRLMAAYRISGFAAILALAGAQVVPFVVYQDHGFLDPWRWTALPAGGAALIFLSVYLQYKYYKKHFPPK
jgi:hypothetical protein